MSRVLVICPHMDDEVLGPGGAIARHVDRGDRVDVVICAHRVYDHAYDAAADARERANCEEARLALGYHETHFLGLPDERLDACVQDVLLPLERAYARIAPDIVYMNHGGDLNQDHRAVFEAAMIVVRPHGGLRPAIVYAYESPSSTDQAFALPQYAFLPNTYMDISTVLERKLQALRAYTREGRPFPHPRSVQGLEVVARRRGTEVGLHAAEAFVMLRAIGMPGEIGR